jgi:hypothetical protein
MMSWSSCTPLKRTHTEAAQQEEAKVDVRGIISCCGAWVVTTPLCYWPRGPE